ncbi:hypothetical protein BIY23_01580 [Wolbachia pipientis]|uniref:Helicase/UvrB N-terminal domain-containing protein n=1 Tax=Wolbachia pipientis TaxID=955 RepID=A0A1E7QKZ4_WOLPI|nr:DEAD/DEAH box helicase family protein [Wolbachia pipientis]OEY87151.1 hypothetical protein BIY23_01580 [Wolbachia pipientis]
MPYKRNAIVENLREVLTRLESAIVNNESQIKFGDSKAGIIPSRRKVIVESILNHLEDSTKDNYSIMIDAETGYGKTYDIGLLSYISAQAGYSHLIAVPNQSSLMNQAKDMISGAFPVNICTAYSIDELINLLQQKNAGPTTLIVQHSLLFKEENFKKLRAVLFDQQKQELLISVDEADSIHDEVSFNNLRKLHTEYNPFYWTATPDARFSNICGKIISPARSNRKCIISVIRAENVITKTNYATKFKLVVAVSLFTEVMPYFLLSLVLNKFIPCATAKIGLTSGVGLASFMINNLIIGCVLMVITVLLTCIVCYVCKKVFDLDVGAAYLKRFIANLKNLFEYEEPSPAYEYIEQCEETFKYREIVSCIIDPQNAKEVLSLIRWNVHSPITESALILANDIDNIMNLNFILQNEDKIYQNGKILPLKRHALYNQIEPEDVSYGYYRLKLREQNFVNCIKQQYPNISEDCISKLKDKIDLTNSTPQYLKYRVLHGFIDLTLQYLTGYDNTELDKQRKEDLLKLVNLICNKLLIDCPDGKIEERDIEKLICFLEEKGFSKDFARNQLLPQIKDVILFLTNYSGDNQKLIIDNWRLSNELHFLMHRFMKSCDNLNLFCKQNKCIFAGFDSNDLHIAEKKPFFKISYNDGKCDAEYCDYDDCDIETLAKCGLITLVDGSKGRGFDSEYNHVVSMFTQSYSEFNNPSDTLQNLGRNRERNPYRQSWFFVAYGRKTKLFVEDVLNKLNLEQTAFFKKVLLPAQKKFNKLKKGRIGIELKQQIEIYVANVINKKAEHEGLRYDILKGYINALVFKTYQELHKMNHFNEKETLKDLKKTLKDTEKYLSKYEDRIRNKGRLDILYRMGYSVVSIMMKAIYYLWVASDRIIFKVQHALNIGKNVNCNKAITYIHIVNNYSLERVLKCQKVMNKAYELANKYSNQDMKKILNLVQSKIYINVLDQSISALSESDLLTILNVLYPRDDNKDRLNKIIQFKTDLTNLSQEKMMGKYQCLELLNIVKYINKVNNEIVKCQKYYYSIDDNNNSASCLGVHYKVLEALDARSYYTWEQFSIKWEQKEVDLYSLGYYLVNFVYNIVTTSAIIYFWDLCKYSLTRTIKVIPINYIDSLFYTITSFTQTIPIDITAFAQTIPIHFMDPFVSISVSIFMSAWCLLFTFMQLNRDAFTGFLFDININKDVLLDMNKLELIDKQEEVNSVINVQGIINLINQQEGKDAFMPVTS